MAQCSSEATQVLFPGEAEMLVDSLKQFGIEEIGSLEWRKQHEYLEKLNMQAVVNASQQTDEFVKSFLVSYQKVKVLIHNLIAVEIWKKNVFPVLVKTVKQVKSTFPCYMVLYHEATLINLLETTFFFQECCESAEDSVLDLVDYCHRKLVSLISSQENEEVGSEESQEFNDLNEETQSSLKELKQQQSDLEFSISIRCISVIQYIISHIESLPLSAATRILNRHDFPCIFVSLIENPPWSRNNGREKFSDGKWKSICPEDRFQLTKLEAQAWLAVYYLLMKPDCQRKYEFNISNKNRIIKLRAHLMEQYLDQIPNLADLQRYLEHLALMDPPMPKGELVLEQVPEIYDTMIRRHTGRWEKHARLQLELLFNPSEGELRDQAKKWLDTYNLEVLDNLIPESPKCALCGSAATKRCSRCRNEWYCGRECQVKHWNKHKPLCNVVATGNP